MFSPHSYLTDVFHPNNGISVSSVETRKEKHSTLLNQANTFESSKVKKRSLVNSPTIPPKYKNINVEKISRLTERNYDYS